MNWWRLLIMKVKPGDIIKEYSTRAPKRHLASYLIIEAGEPIIARTGTKYQLFKEGCERSPKTFKCMCLVNNVETIDDKPGDTTILKGDWINSEAEALDKIWSSFWKVNNEV